MKKIREDKLAHHWLGNYILKSFAALTAQGYDSFLFHRWGVYEYLCSLALHYLKNHNVVTPWTYGVLNFHQLPNKFHDPVKYLTEVTYADLDGMALLPDELYRSLVSNASLQLVSNNENDPETDRLIAIAKDSGIEIVDMEHFNHPG